MKIIPTNEIVNWYYDNMDDAESSDLVFTDPDLIQKAFALLPDLIIELMQYRADGGDRDAERFLDIKDIYGDLDAGC